MTTKELKRKYINFFVKKGHRKLPNVSLVPAEVDASVLFTTAGMHPLVPYLLGEPHPLGKRLVSNQRCLRTDDIDNVGNGFHHTFFEMLGNWSLGDYWKKEAIGWSWEFLTKVLGIDSEKISVSCFAGDKDAPRDEESASIWRSLGIPKERVYFLSKKENWWGPVGQTGPCGPDTEMFFDTGKKKCCSGCDVSCQCGKYVEVWNDVFMQYNRTSTGEYEPLKQKNVDTGMGVERVTAVTSGFNDDNYQTELFQPIIKKIEALSGKKYPASNPSLGTHDREPRRKDLSAFRIIADHLRAATFMIADGVVPSNVEQGYILRRLIRRAIVSGRSLGIEGEFIAKIAQTAIESYQEEYSHLKKNEGEIKKSLVSEEEKFAQVVSSRTLGRVRNQYQQITGQNLNPTEKAMETAGVTFNSCATYGLPLEICLEMAREVGLVKTDREEEEVKKAFAEKMEEHRKKSRASLDKKFAGGLADHSEVVTKLHTATHLLHQALRDVLGNHVRQVGSNITPSRLRFDFTHPKKLTDKQIKKVEQIINEKIKANLPVKMEMVTLEEAKKRGAQALFADKYGNKVKLYYIGPSAGSGQVPYSIEVCGGPHVTSTAKLKGVKIVKEKAVSAGRRRIYATLT